jgi:hypothetical protein
LQYNFDDGHYLAREFTVNSHPTALDGNLEACGARFILFIIKDLCNTLEPKTFFPWDQKSGEPTIDGIQAPIAWGSPGSRRDRHKLCT